MRMGRHRTIRVRMGPCAHAGEPSVSLSFPRRRCMRRPARPTASPPTSAASPAASTRSTTTSRGRSGRAGPHRLAPAGLPAITEAPARGCNAGLTRPPPPPSRRLAPAPSPPRPAAAVRGGDPAGAGAGEEAPAAGGGEPRRRERQQRGRGQGGAAAAVRHRPRRVRALPLPHGGARLGRVAVSGAAQFLLEYFFLISTCGDFPALCDSQWVERVTLGRGPFNSGIVLRSRAGASHRRRFLFGDSNL